MKVMREVVVEILEQANGPMAFNTIWEKTQSELSSNWIDSAKFLRSKMGELYTMLTTNGEFVKDNDDNWSLTKNYTFSEVQKMKINAGELDD